MCLLARKQFKICGVYSSSCYQQGNSVRLRIYEIWKQCHRCDVYEGPDHQEGSSF